jgi:hypothetical protein
MRLGEGSKLCISARPRKFHALRSTWAPGMPGEERYACRRHYTWRCGKYGGRLAKGMKRVVTHLGAAVLSMGDLAALLVMEGPEIGGLGSEAAYGEKCMAWFDSHGVRLMSMETLAGPLRAAHRGE